MSDTGSPARRPGWHVLLVGMMASGKSTLGRLLAEHLQRRHVDTDDEIVRRAGRPISEIFATEGEAAFRSVEKRVLAEALDTPQPAVISVGGGIVLDPDNRRAMSGAGQVVWLRASTETLVARVGNGAGRPLLHQDPVASLHRLGAERHQLYADLASVVLHVDGAGPDELVRRLAGLLVATVHVPLGERSYDVLVGPGARHRLASLIPSSARRAVVVTQANVPVMVETGTETHRLELPDGEGAKSFAVLERLTRDLARLGLTRRDVVVAVGGGAVSDVAGMAAALWHRGTPVIHVPTTLLGQVDAAIGGKTAVNIPEGKNLVGTIWQPHGVICDIDTLATLPAGEWRSGLGEMAKCAFLGVGNLDELPLAEQVRACVALKVEVVASDEREDGRRAILNYGHTLAHALEAAAFAGPGIRNGDSRATTLRHGEAVGIGLVFAARLAERLGRIDAARVRRHVELVSGYGLPTELPAGSDLDELITLMSRDKKSTGGDGLTFVLDGPRGVERVTGVDPAVVADVLATPLDGPPAGAAAGAGAGAAATRAGA